MEKIMRIFIEYLKSEMVGKLLIKLKAFENKRAGLQKYI